MTTARDAASRGDEGCAVTAVGTRNQSRLATVATRLAHRIAVYLGVSAPPSGVVEVHQGRGTPYTRGRRVHLFTTKGGHPELGQLPHELVHLVAGLSPQRFLSEGLAVDVAARVAPRRVWPSFRLTPDEWVALLRSKHQMLPAISDLVEAFPSMRLAQSAADGGAAIRKAATAYAVAGSFVHFLHTSLDGREFWHGYHCGVMWKGPAELMSLEDAWIRALPQELSDEARVRLSASLADSRRQMARAAAD